MKAIKKINEKTVAKTFDALEWFPELDRLLSHFNIKHIKIDLENNKSEDVTFEIGMSDSDYFSA